MNTILFFTIIIIIVFIKIEFEKAIKKKKNYKTDNNKKIKIKKEYKPNYHKSNYDSLYKQKTKICNKKRKEKGDEYEKYISEYFKQKGYISYEHGLEKGMKDEGIDLFLKKDKEYLFVQCKNWNKNNRWKMGKKKIIEYQEKAKQYMIKNPRISRTIIDLNYTIKLIFISSEDIYTQGAKQYIKENSHIMGYKVIPMKNN